MIAKTANQGKHDRVNSEAYVSEGKLHERPPTRSTDVEKGRRYKLGDGREQLNGPHTRIPVHLAKSLLASRPATNRRKPVATKPDLLHSMAVAGEIQQTSTTAAFKIRTASPLLTDRM